MYCENEGWSNYYININALVIKAVLCLFNWSKKFVTYNFYSNIVVKSTNRCVYSSWHCYIWQCQQLYLYTYCYLLILASAFNIWSCTLLPLLQSIVITDTLPAVLHTPVWTVLVLISDVSSITCIGFLGPK